MNKIEKTKEDWIKELSSSNVCFYNLKINGKRTQISNFFKNASDEQKKDKELIALSFEKTGYISEIPEQLIDFDFIKIFFGIKKSFKVLYIPYEWKNNKEEKEYLEKILETFKNKRDSKYSNEYNMLWTFEKGFWDDLNYTKQIKKFNYNFIDFSIIANLKKSKDENKVNYLLEMVAEKPYYLKYLTAKQKSLLPMKVILDYTKNHGLKSLTKDQTNNYEIIKEAFYNYRIFYKEIDNKWKTPNILKDLLNNANIWKANINNQQLIDINELTPELLNNREVIKVSMSDGLNLIKLKRTQWFKDKELKKLALKNYPNYKVIEDCLDDEEMVMELLNSFNESNNIYISGVDLFKQMSQFSKKIFENKELMKKYLSLNELKKYGQSINIVPKAIEVINTYHLDELIELVNINKEVYKILPLDMKNQWELILKFYTKDVNISNFPDKIQEIIIESSHIYEERLAKVKSYALEANLSRSLVNKETIKKMKI